MKRLLITLTTLILFSSTPALAEDKAEAPEQEDNEDEVGEVEKDEKDDGYKSDTVFGNGGVTDSGGYGGPVIKTARVMKKMVTFMGGRGGWIVNHSLVIGGGGYGMITEVDAPDDPLDRKISVSYGGFHVEYTFASSRAFHLHSSLILGAGSVGLQEKDEDRGKRSDTDEEDDGFAVVEPELYGEFNITQWFRIGFGGTYLHTSGAKLRDIGDKDISGPTFTVLFRFGSF